MSAAPSARQELCDEGLAALAAQVGGALLTARWRLVTAESCTGGWITKCLTDIAGSSRWFERGYVTYSNRAKQQALGVPARTLEDCGAVSASTAAEMATRALQLSAADVAIAVTGIAGPDGGTAKKPVGLVWLALARTGAPVRTWEQHFNGDRDAIRRASVAAALRMVLSAAQAAALVVPEARAPAQS